MVKNSRGKASVEGGKTNLVAKKATPLIAVGKEASYSIHILWNKIEINKVYESLDLGEMNLLRNLSIAI